MKHRIEAPPPPCDAPTWTPPALKHPAMQTAIPKEAAS